MKLSIKKGHIVLGALVLALGAAVYLNWDYMKQTDYVAAGNTNQTTNENEGTANYGDAYFVSARLSRTQSRDEAMDALKYMLEDSAMEEGAAAVLAQQAQSLAKTIETEGKIENIIKAKGFTECMVYLDEDKVDVIVQSTGLTDSEAAQIMDAVMSEVEVEESNVSIIAQMSIVNAKKLKIYFYSASRHSRKHIAEVFQPNISRG